jgi:hypothetical protein
MPMAGARMHGLDRREIGGAERAQDVQRVLSRRRTGDLLLHHLVPGDEDAVRPDAEVVRGTTNMPLTHITNSRPTTRPAEMNHFSPLMIHSSPSRSARVLNRFGSLPTQSGSS